MIDDKALFPLLLKRLNYLTAMGDKNIWGWRSKSQTRRGSFCVLESIKEQKEGKQIYRREMTSKRRETVSYNERKETLLFFNYESRIHCYTLALRVGGKATREIWGLTFVVAGGLTIMHHLHIPDYLPTERELQLNSMYRAKRQWTQMFNIWLWVELTLLCDGGVKTLFRFVSMLRSRCLERTI